MNLKIDRNGGLLHGAFWFEDWHMPDPDDTQLQKALWTARYKRSSLTQLDAYRILNAAESYCHLAGHPASTKSIIAQLRKLRTAVRKNRSK